MAQILEQLNVGVEHWRSASFSVFLWFWRTGEQAISRYLYGLEVEAQELNKDVVGGVQQSELEVACDAGGDGEDDENEVERETGTKMLLKDSAWNHKCWLVA